jgi:hypothetical protein
MVLGGAVSTGRHYLAGQDYRHDIQVADLPVPSTPQRQVSSSSQLRTWADFQTELNSDDSAYVVAAIEQAAKAEAQPALIDDALMARAQPQPPIDTTPPVTPAQPNRQMQMVGPDGVVFQRSHASRHQGGEAVKEAWPVAPPAIEMREQARVIATLVPTEEPSTPTPESKKTGEVAVSQTSGANLSTSPTPTKSGGLMVGPDGVIFRPVGATQPVSPH